MRSDSVSSGALRRSLIIGLLLGTLLVLLMIRVLAIQTIDFERYQSKVIEQMTTESALNARRGNIYDSNGVLLATNITTYRVFISPRSIASFDKAKGLPAGASAENIARGLSGILGEDYGITYDFALKQTTYTRYLDRTIARNVDEETVAKIRTFIDAGKYNDQIYAEATSTRYYPQDTLGAHVIGFTGSDGAGLYGLELKYNELLRGSDGKYITARDSHGNEMPYEYQSYVPAKDGDSIYTTLNSYVQSVLEEQLEATLIESGANNRVCGIVMDVRDGSILGMAIAPAFSLNDPWKLNDESLSKLAASGFAEGSDEYARLARELREFTWSNKAITEVYMPGSTFKVMTVSMVLEEKLAKLTDKFFCSGSLMVGGRTIHCHVTRGHGSLDLVGGLQQSCNPVMMTLGARLGNERFYNYIRLFGYLEKTGIDLPGEGSTLFWPRSYFGEVDLAVASFGQNFKVTAIQQLCAVASVANGGYLVTPHLVDRVTDREGNVVYKFENSIKRQIISGEVSATVAEILEGGVSGGAGGKNAYVAGFRVAAKTGTSEKVGDDRSLRIGSCVAFAPADDPQYAVIIIVDEPTLGSIYGSVVAAPYVGAVLGKILPYLGVEPVYTDDELKNMAVKTPGFVNWSVSLAKSYADNLDIAVEIRGEGKYVIKQSPAAGSYMEQSSGKIILYTSNDAPQSGVKVPDVMGRSALSANGVIINAGLNIKIEGTRNYLNGTGAVVVAQSPAAGEVVIEGTVVTLTFRYLDETDD